MNWSRLYGCIATGCGYSWPVIDAMTLPAVHELMAYWREHPPVHLLLAAALRRAPEAAEDFSALMALAPGGVLALDRRGG